MVEPENQKKNTAIDKEIVEKYRDEHDPHFLAYCHYGDNHVLRKEFLSLIDQAYISEKVLETMRDGISDMIARGVVNPCISNGNDNELVDALNIRFNEAKSIDELAAVFREARSKNIEIKEEFDNAFFMIHFLKKIIQNEDEETSKKSLNDILNFMFYVYEQGWTTRTVCSTSATSTTSPSSCPESPTDPSDASSGCTTRCTGSSGSTCSVTSRSSAR